MRVETGVWGIFNSHLKMARNVRRSAACGVDFGGARRDLDVLCRQAGCWRGVPGRDCVGRHPLGASHRCRGWGHAHRAGPCEASHKIRLAGIDAPERAQPFGDRSRQHLARLVFRQVVFIDAAGQDRYGRVIGKVLLNGQDVNLAQVQAGMAWHYKRYEQDQSPADRRLYRDAEDSARSARRGLWQDVAPVAPWEFRGAARPRAP